MAKKVTDTLLREMFVTDFEGTSATVHCILPSNTSKVRQLLGRLMGPDFAESSGYPLPYEFPWWFYPSIFVASVVLLATVALLVIRHRYVRRDDMLRDDLEATQRELTEVRAERQRVDTILALAGCGIDIVDGNNRIVYADSAIERKYGDWRGKNCHGYYCDSDEPCPGCRKPGPSDDLHPAMLDLDGVDPRADDDPHAKVHLIDGMATRMIGVPFRDETGRWLYARIHIPLAMATDSASDSDQNLVSLQHG